MRMRFLKKIKVLVSYTWHVVSGGVARSQALNAAYARRDWLQFDALLGDARLSPLTGLVWQTLKRDYFEEFKDAASEWKMVSKELGRRGHFLGYLAFQNYLSALVAQGDLDAFKSDFPRLHSEFLGSFPANAISGAGALFIRNEDFAGGLKFLDELQKGLPASAQAQVKLKSFATKWLAHYGLRDGDACLDFSISTGLEREMKRIFQTGSPASLVLDSFQQCWSAIRKTQTRISNEIRYFPKEQEDLRRHILGALKEKRPLLFLRLGDGEAYAFNNAATDAVPDFHAQLERMWWGKVLREDLRDRVAQQVQNTIEQADVIGLPSLPRLAQVLHEFRPGPMSLATRKQRALFMGVEGLLGSKDLSCNWWVDEYSNYALVDETYVMELFQAAVHVVLVGCFPIPRGHMLNHPNVRVILIPPALKVSKLDGMDDDGPCLPEILEELRAEIRSLLGPGSLLLLSGGLAGKPLLLDAKQLGAVAVDFGSGLDRMLGHQTRSSELNHLFSRSDMGGRKNENCEIEGLSSNKT